MQELINKAKEKNKTVNSVYFDQFLKQIDIVNQKIVTKEAIPSLFGGEADLIDALIEIAAHNTGEADLLLS
ncbi:hypothetical protein MYOV065v1_p0031 [Vibrio phage PS15B.2]|nr:hypothetical protein MYOV065v1_p0031 [Vibrio phage PS15B.2]QZI90830.1 hypothetical protein MYOV066v1_p0052 [Vibrio phage PS15B.3]QZI90881.1 hypothetical protein MYOV064v1_p0031 [Vibrio phage PS15B.4]